MTITINITVTRIKKKNYIVTLLILAIMSVSCIISNFSNTTHKWTNTSTKVWYVRPGIFIKNKLDPLRNNFDHITSSPGTPFNVTHPLRLQQLKLPPVTWLRVQHILKAAMSLCLEDFKSAQVLRSPGKPPDSQRVVQLALEAAMFTSLYGPAVYCACAWCFI